MPTPHCPGPGPGGWTLWKGLMGAEGLVPAGQCGAGTEKLPAPCHRHLGHFLARPEPGVLPNPSRTWKNAAEFLIHSKNDADHKGNLGVRKNQTLGHPSPAAELSCRRPGEAHTRERGQCCFLMLLTTRAGL